jgi:hypothetical protein
VTAAEREAYAAGFRKGLIAAVRRQTPTSPARLAVVASHGELTAAGRAHLLDPQMATSA